MKKGSFSALFCAISVGVGLWPSQLWAAAQTNSADNKLGIGVKPEGREMVDQAEVTHKVAELEVPFITNQGQADERVKFYAHTFGGTVFITNNGEIETVALLQSDS